MLVKAYKFAIEKHATELRKVSFDPYFVHPIMVSEFTKKYKKSKNKNLLVICALLHDTVEDTDTSLEEIKDLFGEDVANIVSELTSDKDKYVEMGGKCEYLKNKLVSISNYSLYIKLCDRLSNISDLDDENTNCDFRDKYLLETIEIISYLKSNRELTQSQLNVINAINNVLFGLEYRYEESSECAKKIKQLKNTFPKKLSYSY